MVKADELGPITVNLPHEDLDAARARMERLAHRMVPGQRVIAVTGRWRGALGWSASTWEIWRNGDQVGAVLVSPTAYAFRRARAISLASHAA